VFQEKTVQSGMVRLTFEVRDTGIGIGEEQMESLFKPLTSGNTSFSRKYGGLGMGLAISQSLATLMGGEITCESRLGEGSIFRLTLPFSLPESASDGVEEASDTAVLEALQGMRVLVAEDNIINQMIVEEILTSAGIEVTLADNGIRALEALKEGRFDVILMDIQMPEMDGLTATAQIRADHRYDNLPVLAMTANAAAEHQAESMSVGMNDHLTKPIDVNQLYNALKKWGKRGLSPSS